MSRNSANDSIQKRHRDDQQNRQSAAYGGQPLVPGAYYELYEKPVECDDYNGNRWPPGSHSLQPWRQIFVFPQNHGSQSFSCFPGDVNDSAMGKQAYPKPNRVDDPDPPVLEDGDGEKCNASHGSDDYKISVSELRGPVVSVDKMPDGEHPFTARSRSKAGSFRHFPSLRR